MFSSAVACSIRYFRYFQMTKIVGPFVVFVAIVSSLCAFGPHTANAQDKKYHGDNKNVPSDNPVVVTAPTAYKPTPSTFVVPISVNDITATGVIAFQFNLNYDPNVIDPSGTNFGCSTTGTLAGAVGMTATCNVLPDGTLRVSVSGPVAMTGSGQILRLTFTTFPSAVAGNVSPLNFQNSFYFNNNGAVTNIPVNGQIILVGPTAANASLSGRVTTADGRGIRNAIVKIAGSNLAQPLVAQTGSFGWYSFDSLQSGETYIITVNAKRFTFQAPSRVISLSDNISDVDFTADPIQ